MKEPFRYYLRVRYGECDAQKVVFNAHYGHYAGLAAMEFLRHLPVRENLIAGEDCDFQMVKLAVEWKAPARFDQVLEITVAATGVGTSSFTLGSEFRIAGSSAVIATAESVRVHLDPATMTKAPIPPHLKEALLHGALGVQVDHAGYLG